MKALLPCLAIFAALAAACGTSAPEDAPLVTPENADATAVASLRPATPISLATSIPGPTPTPVPDGVLRLNAVGDLMLARDIIDLMDAHGSVYPFERVRSVLADADITVANMEGTFTERGMAATKFYTFRTPPRHAVGLREAGIDVVALGNNHTMDFGDVALTDTLAAIDAARVLRSGAGVDAGSARAPAIVDAEGLRVAFLSYNAVLEATFAGAGTAGVARASVAAIQEDVRVAAPQVDVVVVSLHAGTEYTDSPTAEQRTLARAAIDAGALLVLGSHPHVLQGWERYGGGLIVYSLGNFVFDLDSEDLATLGPRPFQSIILHVEVDREGIREVTYTPVFIDPVENRPLPATPEQARLIEERLQTLGGLVR